MEFLIKNNNINDYSTVTNGLVDYTFEYDYSTQSMKHGNLTVAKYLESKGVTDYEIISNDEFMTRHDEWFRSTYLTPAIEITEEQFIDSLEVLPPMDWHRDTDGIEKFMMIERLIGDITAQYGRLGDKYICKNVVIGDKSTHITIADFN